MSGDRVLVEATGLEKSLGTGWRRFVGRVHALRGVTMRVERGEAIALLGHNGAGKTTLLRALAGVFRPDAGRLLTRGTVSPIIGFGSPFAADLSVRDHLRSYRRLSGTPLSEALALDFSGLVEHADRSVRYLSTGQRVRLAMTMGMLSPVDLYLIDEALAVCDADFRRRAIDHLQRRCIEGAAVIFATHNLSTAQALCERGIVMEQGSVRADAPIDSAIAHLIHGMAGALPESAMAVIAELGAAVDPGTGLVRLDAVVDCTGLETLLFSTVVRDAVGTTRFSSRMTRSVPAGTGADRVRFAVVVPELGVPLEECTYSVVVSDSTGGRLAARENEPLAGWCAGRAGGGVRAGASAGRARA